MPSSKTFREAAVAALANAHELCAEAKLLAENNHTSRAAALAVIGVEEFAKSVAYTLAAIFPEQSDGIRGRLILHDVKHWVANVFEGAQIVTDEWPLIVFQETGMWLSSQQVLTDIFVELSRNGLSGVVPNDEQAKEHNKKSKFENDRHIATPFIKNAAFYVDISPTGEVLSPGRVERFANAEIGGLEWYLDHSSTLREVLSDDPVWERFSDEVRSHFRD
jgi:AbiV family abortive infection protein